MHCYTSVYLLSSSMRAYLRLQQSQAHSNAAVRTKTELWHVAHAADQGLLAFSSGINLFVVCHYAAK